MLKYKIAYFSLLIFCLLISKSFQQLTNDQKKAKLRLQIFTSENKNKTIEINYIQSDNVIKSQLETICSSANKPLLKFIVHGFAETWNMTNRWNWVDVMKTEMLKSAESNKVCVVVLDWRELAKGGDFISNYWKAISNMNIAADLLTKFFSLNKVNENNMHCIGFSLGCHMCSIFYKAFQTKFKLKPYRITGLDPAGPFYKDKPLSEKLNLNDAQFVDIIHTSENFGLADKLGHMDFFVDNGPSEVTACSGIKDRFDTSDKFILYEEDKNSKSYDDVYLSDKDVVENGGFNSLSVNKVYNLAKKLFSSIWNFLTNKSKRVFLNLHAFFGCSHLMSVRIFIFSINECLFRVNYCNSIREFKTDKCYKSNNTGYPRMGYYADLSDEFYKISKGSFFSITNSTPPFCNDRLADRNKKLIF